MGVAIVIIGIGVVVGQVRGGGARGLIPLGLIAALALVPVSAIDDLADRGIGDRTYRPTELTDLEAEYEHGVGRLILDLSDLELDTSDKRTIDIDLGIGQVDVIVPATLGGVINVDARVDVDLEIDGGGFDLGTTNELDLGRLRLQGEQGEIVLNIHVGVGSSTLRIEGDS